MVTKPDDAYCSAASRLFPRKAPGFATAEQNDSERMRNAPKQGYNLT